MLLNDKIRYLYCEKRLNAREVGEKLGLGTFAVIKRMVRHNIPRRTSGASHRLLFLKKPLSYTLKSKLNSKEKMLKTASLMLYWAEGGKACKSKIDFANSDKFMVSLFLCALRKVYRVDETRIRVLIFCYPNQSPDKLIEFWSDYLDLPKSQFTKPYIRKYFDKKKENRLPYGVVHINYSDKKLFMQIMSDIDIIQRQLQS